MKIHSIHVQPGMLPSCLRRYHADENHPIHFASEIFQIKSVVDVAQYRDMFALCLKKAFSLEKVLMSGVKRADTSSV